MYFNMDTVSKTITSNLIFKLYLASIYWFNEIITDSLINSGEHVHHYSYQPDAKKKMNGVNC